MRPSSRLSARAFWGLANWALPLAVVFLVSPRLLHLLGAERFGALMIALVTPIIACQLDFGVTSAALRRFSARLTSGRVDAGTTLFTLSAALLIIGIILGVTLWITAAPVSSVLGFTDTLGVAQGPALVKACAIWTVVSLGTLMPGVLARAAQALILTSILQTVATVVLWAGAWILLRGDYSLVSVVGLGIGLSIVTAGATLVAMRRLVEWRGPVEFSSRLLSEEARFSGGIFAAQAAGALVNQGDRMLVSALGSPAMAGLYALSANVANKSVAAVVAITSFVFPHAAALKSAGHHDRTIGLVHALDRSIAALMMPMLVPGLLLAGEFLRLWLGHFATPELVVAFRILVVAFGVLCFAVPVSNVLVAGGESVMPALFSWLTVVIAFGTMVIAVPRFGLLGAAWAMLLGYSTSLIFAAVARRRLGIPRAEGRWRLWSGLIIGAAIQVGLIEALRPMVTGWLSLLAVGATAWASSYLARALVLALTPEEAALLGRLSRPVSRKL